MTEVKTLVAFTDKETGIFHKKGDAFSLSDARAKELAEVGAIEIMEKAAPAKKKKTAKKK